MIETQNLTKSFGPIHAVNDLSFSLAKGEVLGFLGPNGAGKSTTMKMLTCFLAPTSGTAKVCGHDILADPMAVRKVIGYLPESAPAYGEMSVQAFLQFVGKIRGYSGSELDSRVGSVFDQCQLGSVRHQIFETLSKGYKRRVCLAQALIHDPEVLIMDEPTDGLDPNQKHEVRTLIGNMAQDKAIILSTHILEEVDAVCSRAIIIAEGKLVADGTPQELKERSKYRGAVTVALKIEDAVAVQAELEKVSGVARVELLGEAENGLKRYLIYAKPGKKISSEVAQLAHDRSWEVDAFSVDEGRLDEVFRTLTTGGDVKGGKQAA